MDEFLNDRLWERSDNTNHDEQRNSIPYPLISNTLT